MIQTSSDVERKFLKYLSRNTGRNLDEWMKVLGHMEKSDRNSIILKLRAESNLNQIEASLLAGIFLNRGRLVYEPGSKNEYNS